MSRPRHLRGHFTANTMGLALEFLGIARAGSTLVAADELERRAADAAAAGGSPCASRGGPTARAFLERRSLLNAMAGIAASGGSTNGVLHLLAIAREAGVALTLDDLFARASRGDAGHREPHARRALRGDRPPRRRRRARSSSAS